MSRKSPPTEAVLETARPLDGCSVAEMLGTIHAEDRRALAAIEPALPELERAVGVLEACLRGGGRWFNLGAGTSGRLGALDAAEIPPTFGFAPERVVAVIAGGSEALWRAVEGAEDDAEAARDALRERALSPADVVVLLSASGRTPFTLGAAEEARRVGARSIAICCDAGSPLAHAADIAIALEVGPELVAGSTRMKGGLAQKAVLHMLSTAVMVRLGRVRQNLMTHLQPASEKLRRRRVAIVARLAGCDEARAAALIEACGGDVARAVEQAQQERVQGS